MNQHHRLLFISVFTLVAAPFLAGCAEEGSGPGTGDGESLTFRMGTLMPLTGPLNNLGPSMQNGAKLAIDEINAANAGIRIEASHEDDRTTDTAAITNTFNLLVSRGVTGIAGPCCSGITGSVLDLAMQNEVVVASPSATSPALTERDNGGYFWRVPPTDAGQGVVLAALVASENVTRANMIVINNDYGNGLAEVFQQHFTTSLSGVVPTVARFDEGATEFSSQVTQACTGAGSAVDGIVLVAYTDDAAAIFKAMQNQDCLSKVRVFASEGIYDAAGNVADRAGTGPDGKSLAEGLMGTTPQPAAASWTDKYRAKYNEDPLTYAAESYDAVMYLALAALKAGSVEGRVYKEELLNIANAPGTECTEFAECAALIAAGTDIDYVGFAHNLEFTEKHEPRTGAYAYWKIENGEPVFVRENVTADTV